MKSAVSEKERRSSFYDQNRGNFSRAAHGRLLLAWSWCFFLGVFLGVLLRIALFAGLFGLGGIDAAFVRACFSSLLGVVAATCLEIGRASG